MSITITFVNAKIARKDTTFSAPKKYLIWLKIWHGTTANIIKWWNKANKK